MAINLPPGANELGRLKLWSDIIATWVTIFGVFSGGIFAVLQYVDRASAERVRETLQYVEKYNEGSILQARTRLENFWNPRAEEVFAKQRQGERVLYVYLDAEIRRNRLEGDVSLLNAFFDNLRTCTCANLCDLATVERFFGKDASDLNGLLFPYAAEQRKRLNDASIGASLELLAKSRKSGFARAYCASGR